MLILCGIGTVGLAAVAFTRDLDLVQSLQLFVLFVATLLLTLWTLRPKTRRGSLDTAELCQRMVDGMQQGAGFQDENGRITYVNRRLGQMLGYPVDELLGRSVSDLIAKSDRESFSSQMARRRRGDNEPYEIWFERRDGSKLRSLLTPQPIYDDRGQFRGSFAIITDITERTHAEKALRESEELLHSIVESMSDGILVLDDRFRYTYWNRTMEELTSVRRETVLADPRPPWEIFPHLTQHGVDRMMAQAMGGEIVHREAIPYTREDGQSGFTSETFLPLRTPDNGIRGIVGVVRDVTERHRAAEEQRNLEAQVQHSQKLESLGVLAGGIAHDFNNLLHGIGANADLALMDLPDNAPAAKNLGAILKTSQRAAELCRQMLAYSGKGQFTVEPLDLSDLVADTVDLLQVSISKRIHLQYDLDESLSTVEADAAQIRQIVLNLVTNASDAIGEASGTIVIRTGSMSCNEDYLKTVYTGAGIKAGTYNYFEVEDDGCGMDAETQHRMFEPFFTSKGTSRGLGLAAVLGIVRGHQGALEVQSVPGKGTTLRVLFPSTDQETKDSSTKDTDTMTGWQGYGTVLVVDDEMAILDVAQQTLTAYGFQVRTARDGLEALDRFDRYCDEVVAVLLDVTMPRLDGRETLIELRRRRGDLPILLSSGYAPQGKGRLPEDAITGFLQKPYRPVELASRLRQLLES